MITCDVAVLGAGPGGYVSAIRLAQLGAKVVVVEKDNVGGTCLNRGCIPSKAFLESIKVVSLAKRGADFGLKGTEISFDLSDIVDRKNQIVGRLTRGIEGLFKRRQIQLVKGRGKVKSATEIEVEMSGGQTEVVQAKKLILATGSVPTCLPSIVADEKKVFTSDGLLDLRKMPKSILIIGGGYIGCEFATFFLEAGAEVTIVEMLDAILPKTDGEIVKEMTKIFLKKKVNLLTGTKIEKLEDSGGGVVATLSNGKTVSSEIALACVGRSPATKGLGLEERGLKMEKGFVQVDDRCQTNVGGVFAIGDMTGKMLLAHYASRQGIVAAEVATGHDASMAGAVCPSAIFTHPEVASVGLTEEEVKAKGIEYQVGKFPFQALGMAHAMADTTGFVKIIGGKRNQEILGVHVIGPGAPIMIAEATLAIQLECTVEDLARTIHTHPTLPEAMMEGAEAWLGQAIHLP